MLIRTDCKEQEEEENETNKGNFASVCLCFLFFFLFFEKSKILRLTQENILRGPRSAAPFWLFFLLHLVAKRIRNLKDPWETRRCGITILTGFFVD